MKISVVIPLYNKGERVCRTIKSVLIQNYQDFEIIVVDDGSTDDSANYVKSFCDERIHYVYKENAGVSSARNTGIVESKNEWIYFLDADDELDEGALSSFVELHESFPELKLLAGKSKWMKKGIDVQPNKLHYKKSYVSKTPYFDIWLNRYRPGIRNILVHRDLINKFGVYDVRLSFFEDWEFPLRMLRYGKIAITHKYIGIYNQTEDGLSMSPHPLEKEMAFYIPEYVHRVGFFYKTILYDNIEFTKTVWCKESNEYKFYVEMQNIYFSKIYKYVHWFHHQLVRHKFI